MESTPDQEWQLSYGTLGNPGADIDVQVLVDGKWVDRHHMRKTGAGQVPKHCEGSQSKDRTTVAPRWERFASSSRMMPSVPGSIQLEAWRLGSYGPSSQGAREGEEGG